MMKNKKLHTIKTSGYKTPDQYFDTFEDDVFSNLKMQELTNGSKSSGYKVPKGYFDSLDAKIMDALDKGNNKGTIPLFGWKNVAYTVGIAASLILAFNIVFNSSRPLTFEDLETASIESYLMNEDLSSYDIAPYLGMADIDPQSFTKNIMNPIDIEDYLLQNSDIEHLISEQ